MVYNIEQFQREGTWKEDEFHGEMLCTYKTGLIKKETWKDGQLKQEVFITNSY